eukprot:SAG31_NODE_1432_length_8373_cov_8.838289_9_plen_93_part_00
MVKITFGHGSALQKPNRHTGCFTAHPIILSMFPAVGCLPTRTVSARNRLNGMSAVLQLRKQSSIRVCLTIQLVQCRTSWGCRRAVWMTGSTW